MCEKEFHSGLISLIGRSNVGKSTLLNTILGQKVAITTYKPQTTRNRILGVHNEEDAQFIFLDTPGFHKPANKLGKWMMEIANSAILESDLIILMIEMIKNPVGDKIHINKIDENLIQTISQNKGKTPVYLLINKIDLCAKEQILPIIAAYEQKYAFKEIIPISALKKQGIKELLKSIKKGLPIGPKFYPDEIFTDQAEKTISAEMIREKLMVETQQEIPYSVAVTIDEFVETEKIVNITATIHVEKNSQKGIIIGKGGKRLKTIGTKARLDIEKMLGCKVFLSLFVRVESNWRSSDKSIKKLGIYEM